jgi:hypothetical protein
MSGRFDDWRTPFRWVHGIWALFWLVACTLLVFTGGGHPPPIILLPVALAVWLMGHAALGVLRWLAARGRRAATRHGIESLSWPPGVALATLGTGAVFFLGLLLLAVSAVQQRPYPFRGSLWTVMLVVWACHSVSFVGLLLRRSWSRVLFAGLCFAWTVYLAWQVVTGLAGGRVEVLGLLFALTLGSLLTVLAYHLLSSRRVREFLGIGRGERD